MCLEGKWLSSILTRITQQGPCRLQHQQNGYLEGNFPRTKRRTTAGQCPRTDSEHAATLGNKHQFDLCRKFLERGYESVKLSG